MKSRPSSFPVQQGSKMKILYFTDPLGITEGYMPTFVRLLQACKLDIKDVQFANLHKVVDGALKRRGNEKEMTLSGDEGVRRAVKTYMDHMIQTVKPNLIVTSCSAALGILNGIIYGADKISKTRGSVYSYRGIPSIIVPPISAIHRQQKTKSVDEDLEDSLEGQGDVYKVKDGYWLWVRDWAKVARYAHGKQRQFPAFQYSVTRTIFDLKQAEHWLHDCVLSSHDLETTGSAEAGGYTISCSGYTGLKPTGEMRTFVIPFADKFQPDGVFWQNDSDFAEAVETVRRINANPSVKVYQNGSYDSAYNITWGMPQHNYQLDTMHMWHALYPELDKSLDVIASILLDDYAYWKQDLKGLKEEKGRQRDRDMERFWRYNGLDCHYTLCSGLLLLRLASGTPEVKFNYANEFPQMLSGLAMTMRGLKADFEKREALRQKLEEQYNANIESFRRLIDDPEFNVNSPQQKAELFYTLLGATPRNAKGKIIKGKTGKGKSAGKLALRMIATEHPFFKRVSDSMQAAMEPRTQISNVCDVHVATHRMRSSVSVRTETWRYSSSSSPFWDGTNMQNIRKSMRDWLVADDGYILFDVDYSQSDAVFVAYESNDQKYIKTMSSGQDSHAIHGEFFFKVPYEEIVKGNHKDDPRITHPITGIRNITKRIVHGANFQMAGGTLYVSMGRESVIAAAVKMGYDQALLWDEETLCRFCQALLHRFRGLYPRLSKKGWYGEIAERLKKERKCTNAFGMTRSFIGTPTDSGTQREATAFYGQSDTAGNMNRTMEEIRFGYIPPTFRDGPNAHAKEKPLKLEDKEFGLMTCLQVHDSLVGQLDTRAPRWKEALYNLLLVMERPIIINGHQVSVKTDANVGKHWGKGMIPWKSGDPYDLDRIRA